MKDLKVGFVSNEVFKVEKFGNSFKLIDTKGNKIGAFGISTSTRKSAYKEGKALQSYVNRNGKKTYRKVDMGIYNNLIAPLNT